MQVKTADPFFFLVLFIFFGKIKYHLQFETEAFLFSFSKILLKTDEVMWSKGVFNM